jgi:hypothetical protein
MMCADHGFASQRASKADGGPLKMKKLLPLTVVLTGLLISRFSPLWAQSASDPLESAVQSLGSKTRAEIAKVSQRGADSDRALRFQEEGDQALRRGEPIRAAEEYGRVEEIVDTLNREHATAINERARAEHELARARRAGLPAARAEDELEAGNKALSDGDYADAQIHYHEARTILATR